MKRASAGLLRPKNENWHVSVRWLMLLSMAGGHPNGQGGHEIGELFNARALVAYCGQNKYGHHLWKWSCSRCARINGPSTIASINQRVAAGCRECDRGENHHEWMGSGVLTGKMFSGWRRSALVRGHSWFSDPFLTDDEARSYISELWQQQGGLCAETGWPLRLAQRRKFGGTVSLDRIYSSRGYEVGNIQFVHFDINRSKQIFTPERYHELCEAVVRHQVSKRETKSRLENNNGTTIDA